MTDSTSYAPWLWIFTILLVGRVLGQIVVVLFAPKWLPPMERWQSGLLPYPVLLAAQAVVLWLMFSISIDYTRGSGFWVEPHPSLGLAAVIWSVVYFGAMVVRCFVPRARLMIPIVFHSFVAMFQFTFGWYQIGGWGQVLK